MKRFIFLLITLFFSLNSYAQPENKIAILDFKANGTPQYIGNAIADIITTEFKKDSDLIILERNQIDQILKEKSFQDKEPDTDSAVVYGQALSVDRVIIGSVSKIGDSYTITGKIIEVKSGAIEYADSENCLSIDDVEFATRYLAVKLLNRLSKTYHDLPEKKYFSKPGIDIDINLCARYGIIWGFKIPILILEQSTDEFKIGSREENLSIIEGLLTSDFYTYKGLSFKGLFKYSNSFKIKCYDRYLETSQIDCQYHLANIMYQELSIGFGLQYIFNFEKFKPYINGNIFLSKSWFTKNYGGVIGISSSYQNPSTNAFDGQNYDITFAQNSNIISAEFTAGFNAMITEQFGLNFGLGVNIPFYGSQFSKFNLKKKYSNVDDDLIPLHQRDLETKIKYNENDFIQPPMYFIQLGFIYRI